MRVLNHVALRFSVEFWVLLLSNKGYMSIRQMPIRRKAVISGLKLWDYCFGVAKPKFVNEYEQHSP